MCDNWKVGCRGHVTVDGIVLHREPTDLNALAAQINANSAGVPIDDPATFNPLTDPQSQQFDHGPGGRVTFTSQIANVRCYDIQFVYEGVNDWNAFVVYPKQALPDTALVITPSPNTEPSAPVGNPPIAPDPHFPEGFEQRSLHYRSTLNS